MSEDRYLTFALGKGRLANKTLELFEEIGITCEEMKDKSSRKLIFVNEDLKLRFFLAKGPDVPTYVEYGAADIGVVGSDTILEENKLSLDVTVAIGLVKEQKMDLILQKLTELGVNTIIPLNMERSIVKLDAKKLEKKKVRWETICKEASEQSKRTDIPIIGDIMSLKELVKLDYDMKLIASTKEKNKMLNYYLQSVNKCAKIIVVIGPEGGISDSEELFLNDNNFNSVSFGNLIFRVETAAIYVASILNYYSSTR